MNKDEVSQMRDRFKFRVWNKEEKKMYYDVSVGHYNQVCWDYKKYPNGDTSTSSVGWKYLDEAVILMQSTGLKDQNGKLIYESDILGVDWNDARYPVHNIGPVKWDEEDARWNMGEGGSPKADARHNFEVLGNIHQHPKLLKKEQ